MGQKVGIRARPGIRRPTSLWAAGQGTGGSRNKMACREAEKASEVEMWFLKP